MKILKRFIPVSIILLALIFAGFISSFWVSEPIKRQTNNKVLGVTEIKVSESPTPQPTSLPIKKKTNIISPTSTPIPIPMPSPTISVSTSGETPSSTPSVTSQPAVQTNQINVSINNSSNFTVLVTDGLNQCDVLSKSLEQGKIASLNMKYSSTYETYAVYQINEVGKENQVWWTYSVNGSNSPLGCSHIKANNNDNVVWTYIGPS